MWLKVQRKPHLSASWSQISYMKKKYQEVWRMWKEFLLTTESRRQVRRCGFPWFCIVKKQQKKNMVELWRMSLAISDFCCRFCNENKFHLKLSEHYYHSLWQSLPRMSGLDRSMSKTYFPYCVLLHVIQGHSHTHTTEVQGLFLW